MKTLIVTETVTYHFNVPDDFPFDNESESQSEAEDFFCNLEDPWRAAKSAEVSERDFEIEGAQS